MKNFIIDRIANIKEDLKLNYADEKVVVFLKSKIKTFEGLLEGINDAHLKDVVETAFTFVKVQLAYEMNDPAYLEGKLEAFAEVLEYMKA